jgi:uncharacterized membrane protein YphA (DoxX/SURF4 family)
VRKPGLQLNNILLDIGLRLFVGVTFLIAGVAKLPMHPEWVEAWTAGRLLPTSLTIFYISALPWIEIVIGSCLILGLCTRFFSLVSIPIIASFIVAHVMAFSWDTGCGCFGQVIEITHKWALVVDALLLVGVVLICFQRRRFAALDSRLNLFR